MWAGVSVCAANDCAGRRREGRVDKLGGGELNASPLPRGVGAGGGKAEMTRPITVMEWLCYSWLHTAVCSHSHSPPAHGGGSGGCLSSTRPL